MCMFEQSTYLLTGGTLYERPAICHVGRWHLNALMRRSAGAT